jgi:hypothetical protein
MKNKTTFKQGDRVRCEATPLISGWYGTIEQTMPADDFINEPTASVRADDNGSSYVIPVSQIELSLKSH